MIEAPNYIDAASLDPVEVLNSWHAGIDMLRKEQGMYEMNQGLALNKFKDMLIMTN